MVNTKRILFIFYLKNGFQESTRFHISKEEIKSTFDGIKLEMSKHFDVDISETEFYENTPLKTRIWSIESMMDLDEVIMLKKEDRKKIVKNKKRKLEDLFKNEEILESPSKKQKITESKYSPASPMYKPTESTYSPADTIIDRKELNCEHKFVSCKDEGFIYCEKCGKVKNVPDNVNPWGNSYSGFENVKSGRYFSK